MASPSRSCEVCGGRIYRDNKLGICRNNPECATEYRKVWKLEHRRYFGLTPAERRKMLDAQGHVCYLCQRDLTWEDAYVDHDHAHEPCGGKGCRDCVRGLAHSKCNMIIGQLYDSPEVMRVMANNLAKALASVRARWNDNAGISQ